MAVGIAASELGNLNTVGITGFQSNRDQVATLTSQRQGENGFHSRQQSQSSKQNSLIHKDLWPWLADHGVSRNEIANWLILT